MLFEQVARRLIDVEEHEYTLDTDAEPYVASSHSRVDNPELIAVLGDVVRRMRLLKGTRAAIGRKGFDADLKVLAEASTADLCKPEHDGGQPASNCTWYKMWQLRRP